MKNRIIGLAMHSDMRAARVLMGFGALLWSLFLFWPGDLFPSAEQLVAGTGRQTYAIMAVLAPEWLWGAAFALHGTFLLTSTIFKVPPYAALLDSFNGALLWMVATAACYVSHFNGWATYQPPAAMGADVAMVISSWWWFVRVLADKNYEACH